VTVLLTGATGFVGGEVLDRLVAAGEEVIAVARRPDALSHPHVVKGDLEQELSLPDVDVVVHCAASVSFGLELAEARAINVEGTRRLLDHAVSCGARFVHVSTAYVAGRHHGLWRESYADCGQRFRNTYEQTKLEAELLVQAAPIESTILRPSIVVGDSRTGWTSSFNVLYWPMRAFARGLIAAVPARATSRVDVVPVDYVADAITHVTVARPDVRGTLNLVAGMDAVTAGELVGLTADALGRERPPLVAPGSGQLGELMKHSEEAARYLPYFDMDVLFDDTRARGVLAPAGITAPPLRDYFARLVDYAERTRWGKKPALAA
jgi:long-chain acyl-CoA synthetase